MSEHIAVTGAAGRMGRHVLKAVLEDSELNLSAAVDLGCLGEDAGTLAGLAPCGVKVRPDLHDALRETGTTVLVDFTRGDVAHANALVALAAGVSPIIGATGMSAGQVTEIAEAARAASVGAFIAPNFAIGAVLMMLFARQAAKYLPEVEVIELHHEKKVDAPSGTARRTIEMILEGRGERTAVRPATEDIQIAGARGGDIQGVHVHSVRLPGYVAHQECLFGGLGQTLTIRHDSIDRVSFMPGVLLACKRVRGLTGLVVGLEHLLD